MKLQDLQIRSKSLVEAREALKAEFTQFQGSVQGREMTDAEKAKFDGIIAKLDANEREIKENNLLIDCKTREQSAEQKSKNQQLREFFLANKGGKADGILHREITSSVITSGDTNNMVTAGAIPLTIGDVQLPLEEKTIYGALPGLNIQYGVKGDMQWPVCLTAVECEEVGETAALSDVDIDWSKVTATPKRVGITIKVSYEAVDDADFDLIGFVQGQLAMAEARYINHKMFSQETFSGNKGPWNGLTQTAFAASTPTYRELLAGIAAVEGEGAAIDNLAFVMSSALFWTLKGTPKDAGSGLMVIDDNNCIAGIPVYKSEQVNYKTVSGARTKDTKEHVLVGNMSYFALNQHGEQRFVVDGVTLAGNGEYKFVLNTRWSMTTLETKAFKSYKTA